MRSRTKTVSPQLPYQNLDFQSVRQTGMQAFCLAPKEKRDWDARAVRLMFRHEMDHA